MIEVGDAYEDHASFEYERGFRGCSLLNAAAELPVGDPGRAAVAAHKQEVEELFREHLREMRLTSETSVNKLAEHLSFLFEAAMARAGFEGHNARLKTARKIAVDLLKHL